MISRLAYQQGIVIVTCPGCRSRHLIADKTGLLDWGLWDVEMLAQRGESVTRLTSDGYRQVLGADPAGSAAASLDMSSPELAKSATDLESTLLSGSGAVAGTAAAERPPLLIRNKQGVIEAVPEDNFGIAGAAEFLADEDSETGASSSE